MWVYLVVAALVVLGIVGGIFAGGIFTIVLLPIAAVILGSSIVYTYMGKSAEQSQQADTPEPALPHGQPAAPSEVRTSPQKLADARRASQ
jgi:hypothetical protein